MIVTNIYQFTCAKTINVNPADVSQTQQTKEVVFGSGETMVQAIKAFETFAKGQRLEIMGVGLVGALSF